MATNRFTEADLKNMGLKENPDGSYQKPKTKLQPKEIVKVDLKDGNNYHIVPYPPFNECPPLPQPEQLNFNFRGKEAIKKHAPEALIRTITLNLFGIPMPKQSVMQGRNQKTGAKVFYQKSEKIQRKADYIQQIKKQLPKDFVPFSHELHVRKFHCIYPPLKEFHKKKGKMDAIRNGEIFYKNTQPDLIDNLKKLVFDSMAELVFTNDGIIVTENDTAKYYGIGGCIIITLEGY